MRFARNRAITDEPEPEPPSDVPGPDGAAVELLLADEGRRVGWIDTNGQRTSDWLNAQPSVSVRGLGGPDAASASTGGSVTELERERVVWIVPPPLPPNRHLRLHRRRVLVHLELEGHEVSGQVHIRPGADALDQVLRGTRDFVPLTEVQVVSRTDPTDGASLPVLIVNRSHVRRIVEDVPHVSAPVPDPSMPLPGGILDPRIAWLAPEQVSWPSEPAEAPAASPPPSEPSEPTKPSEAPIETAADLVTAALTILLELGVIDVVEFQSIRARVPAPPEE